MENPFLTPPQVEGPESRSWGLGFVYGFQGPAQSSQTPADIQPEDADAFDQGVLAGQDCAINGLPLPSPCVDLNVQGPEFLHLLTFESPEAGMLAWDLFKGAWAGGILGGVVFLVTLSMALETHSDSPNETLARTVTTLHEQLQNLGFEEPMELFIGGGADTGNTGCELLLTSIFRDPDNAIAAARGLGRSEWLVMSWRTDQSGGARTVASSG
jgi:hypothetical protein